MAAGLGFKTFTTGEVLSASDVNGYLMQGVLVFASTAARDAAITSPQEGQFAFTKDTDQLWYRSASAWVASGATGDIEGVSVTSPITGGGTSGTVTIGIDSTAVVPSQTGNSGKYLTTNGTASSWETISAGGFTQLATGSLSSTVTRIQSIPGTYKELVLYVLKPLFTNTNGTLYFRYNNDSNTRYSSDTGSQNYGDTFRYDAFYCTSDLSNVAADGLYRMEVPHYANTTTWKIAKVYGANNTKSGVANTVQMGTIDGVYNQTGAITEVDIVSTAGNFTGGSYILYGVN